MTPTQVREWTTFLNSLSRDTEDQRGVVDLLIDVANVFDISPEQGKSLFDNMLTCLGLPDVVRSGKRFKAKKKSTEEWQTVRWAPGNMPLLVVLAQYESEAKKIRSKCCGLSARLPWSEFVVRTEALRLYPKPVEA